VTVEKRLREYDPETFWNARARRHGDDPERAAGLDVPGDNRCIDRVQRRLMSAALRQVSCRTPMDGKRVLDFGCGSGRWVGFLRSHGLHYRGVDVAGEMVSLTRQLHPDADVRQSRATELPFPDRSFHIVWSVAAVHHNRTADQECILGEMARVLSAGGFLVLFEGIGGRRAVDTNYFPRPIQDWCGAATALGFTYRWHRGGAYFPLRALLARVAPGQSGISMRPWPELLARAEAAFDPYLAPLLPQRFHTRAAMLFEKTGLKGNGVH